MALAMSTSTIALADDGIPGPEQDPYIFLEEARSPEALDWVAKENARTLAAFEADPRYAQLKAEALAIFDSTGRIPFVSFRPDGLYNFWQDKTNPKGLLRRTTLESYRTASPEWEIILDVDALAKAEGKEWVYQGSTCLPPAMNRCMIALSDGGEDASILREFDTKTKQFIEGGFELAEKSQGGVEWVDENTLLTSSKPSLFKLPSLSASQLIARIFEKSLKLLSSFSTSKPIFILASLLLSSILLW
jgi:prolyl oligopeptidase